MSFTLVAEVMRTKVGSPLKKIILMKLADQANDEGICWPSYRTISESCEICKRSVIKHIRELEDMGFLRIERRYNDAASKNYSNRYHLTLNRGSAEAAPLSDANDSAGAAPLNDANDSAGAALGNAGNALGIANAAPSSSAGAAPKPIIKHINKTVKEAVKLDDTAEQVKNINAEFIVNWNPPSREAMEEKLFIAGVPMQMTDSQYQLYVGDFKAHFEDRAKEGYPLRSDGKCQTKLRDWLQRERESHNKNMNAGGDTANRPHSSRSDAFTTGDKPKLSRAQQLEKNRLAMQQAGLQA